MATKRNLRIMVATLVGLLLSVGYCRAGLMTVEFTAQVTEVDDVNDILAGQIKVGDPVEGSYTYDTVADDTIMGYDDAEACGWTYVFRSPRRGIVLEVGGLTFQTNPLWPELRVEVLNDVSCDDLADPADTIRLESCLDLSPEIAGDALLTGWLGVYFYTDEPPLTALTTCNLPASAPVLEDWEKCLFRVWGLACVGDSEQYVEFKIEGRLLSVSSFIVPPTVIVVDGSGGADYASIQAGINAAADGDTVIVHPGTYTGDGNRDLDFKGKAITVRSIDPNDWNVVADTVIYCEGTRNQPHRGFHFHSGEGLDSVVDGFTVTGGHAESHGGAIFCEGESGPTISKCIIADNVCGVTGAASHGAGISCVDHSDATISHCIISSNFNASPRYDSAGGGLYCHYSAPLIADCMIAGNRTRSGGGLFAGEGADVTVLNCIIRGNIATESGGGLMSKDGLKDLGVVVENCLLINNHAGECGGGVYSHRDKLTMSGCVIASNTAGDGGGVFFSAGDSRLVNCTVANNRAVTHGGGVACGYGGDAAVLENCILWGNTAALGRQASLSNPAHILGSTNLEINYSCIETGPNAGFWDGNFEWVLESGNSGNIDVDPCFVDPRAGDFTLLPHSSCIDAGTNSPSVPLLATDITGVPRLLDGDGDGLATVDMGAYEALHSDEVVIWPSTRDCLFIVEENDRDMQTRTLTVRNSGSGLLNWRVASDCTWLTVRPDGGVSAGQTNDIVLEVNAIGLGVGTYVCDVVISDAAAINDTEAIVVRLRVQGETVHVPDQFDTIQEAIHHTTDGGTVLIADGVYTGPGNRDLSLEGRPMTIRSENGPESCIIDCEGTERDPHHGFEFYDGEDAHSVIDGLTIANAMGSGAAIRCEGSSPEIRNCHIVDCHGVGGIACGTWTSSGETSPTIIGCVISGNDRYGIYCDGSRANPVIVGCVITQNKDDGVYCYGNSPTITDCVVSSNGRFGIHFNYETDTEVSGCLISGNGRNSYERGGVYGDNLHRMSSLRLGQCVIVGNGGAGVRCDGGTLLVDQCSFLDNQTGADYRGHTNEAILTNSILWDAGGVERNDDRSDVSVSYCDVRGGWPGEGNFDVDPLFADPGYWDANGTPDDLDDDFWVDGDYHLKSQAGRWDSASGGWVLDDVTSPCIDAGDPSSPVGDEPQPNGGRINMGAYGGASEASKSF